MNLILQAIKALLRKVESSIAKVSESVPKNLDDLLGGNQIPADRVEGMYYTEPDVITPVFKEQTLAFAAGADWPLDQDGVFACALNDYSYADNAWTSNDNLNNEFVVVWDGVEYKCKYFTNNSECLFLGNASIMRSQYNDTGEPFVIITNIWYDSAGLYIGTLDTSASHTVCIGTLSKGEVRQIPNKYIPEHKHSSEEIEGEFALDNIPTLVADKLPVVPVEKGGTGTTTKCAARHAFGFGAGTCSYSGTQSELNITTEYDISESYLNSADSAGSILIVTVYNAITFTGSPKLWINNIDAGYLKQLAYSNDSITGINPRTEPLDPGIYLFVKTFCGFKSTGYNTGRSPEWVILSKLA